MRERIRRARKARRPSIRRGCWRVTVRGNLVDTNTALLAMGGGRSNRSTPGRLSVLISLPGEGSMTSGSSSFLAEGVLAFSRGTIRYKHRS